MENIHARIKERLQQSEYWTPKTKDNGKTISRLICPKCGDSEAWAYSAEPWAINCNRLNECGVRTKTLKLFPEIVQNIEKENPPSKEDPNRPATVYLHSRGLNESLKGLHHEYWKDIRGTGSGGVMFQVADGVYNGRIFNPPHGEGKTHNKGSTSGVFWKHPEKRYIRGLEIFVTEGIINALSLWEIGFQAIAVLSAGQDPAKVNLSEFSDSSLVLAFDNDKAGHQALKKWKEHFPDARALLPKNGDWNDFILSHRDGAKENFDKQRKEFECLAGLALATDARMYAHLYNAYYGKLPGLFAFEGCYYYSTYKDKEVIAYRVSNFTIEVDHYQLDNSNPEEPVNRYYLKIKPCKGNSVSCAVSANEISSPGGLTQMFLQRARVLWEGDKWPSLALTRHIIESKAPVVRQLQTTGHDKESNSYIFKDFAVNCKGEMILPNKKGFFEISRLEQVRPPHYPTINPVRGADPAQLHTLIYQAWGNSGVTSVAWMVASWFVRRIKAKVGFFPFLSLYGDTQVGKSALTRFLNAFQCHDEEGLPMRKVNTGKGEIRKLAQRAGLFKALLESNDGDNIRFDLDALLTLYNDNPLQVRAVKSNDIQTQEIPFQSSLLFVQNREPFKTKAQKERVMSLQFKEENITPKSTEAFNTLIQISLSEIAYFFPHVMLFREFFEGSWFAEFQRARSDIKGIIGDARITENHALILAFHRMLCTMLHNKEDEYDLTLYIGEIGRKKQKECRHRAESPADLFFEVIDKIKSLSLSDSKLFIDDSDSEYLYVNLNETLNMVKEKGLNFTIPIDKLQSSLREHPAYVDSNKSHWFIKTYMTGDRERKQLRAWIFDQSKINGE